MAATRMTERQALGNEDVSGAARQWQQSETLSAEVLERLYEVNRIYLNVLVLDSSGRPRSEHAATAAIHDLSALEPALRTALARCPFALFNARFHDSAFWTMQIKNAEVQEPFQRFLKFHQNHPDSAAFTDLALFYAWHLVQSNPLAARILLGMSEPTVKAIQKFSLSRMQRLAAEQPRLVTPRWPSQTPFWRGLLHILDAGPAERMEDMQLLGIQMIAAEVAQRGSHM